MSQQGSGVVAGVEGVVDSWQQPINLFIYFIYIWSHWKRSNAVPKPKKIQLLVVNNTIIITWMILMRELKQSST